MFGFSIFSRRIQKATASSSLRSHRRASRGFERLEARLALSGMSFLPPASTLPNEVFSTVPSNGDANPYGVSIVPAGFPSGGMLHAGDALVTNFNSAASGQGTGTTISLIDPSNPLNPPATFFTSSLQGVDTPPVILKSGLVVVGSVPAGPSGTIGQGAIQFLDKNGHLVETLTNSRFLDDPWYLAVNDLGAFVQLFVSNVSGQTGNFGTVTRVDMLILNGKPHVLDMVQIASGYPTRLDSAAFVVGPGGLAYNSQTDTLYVASEDQTVKRKIIVTLGAASEDQNAGETETGTIFAVRNASFALFDHGEGTVVYADPAHLHGPMGLALAPNGDLVIANGDAVNVDLSQPSELVEITPAGQFVSQFSVDPSPGGAFALAFGTIDGHFSLAAVDDNTNTLDVWTVPSPVVPPA